VTHERVANQNIGEPESEWIGRDVEAIPVADGPNDLEPMMPPEFFPLPSRSGF
jgi:hypothetical protein